MGVGNRDGDFSKEFQFIESVERNKDILKGNAVMIRVIK